MRPRKTRMLVLTAVTIGLLLGPLADIATAHVGVSSDNATKGGDATVTFTVPTERDVPTTKIEVAMPTDTPIASVRVAPKPGWDVKVTKTSPPTPLSDDNGPVTQIVSRIVWTATGAGILPDQFDQFVVSAGPLPNADHVVFKVLQTYSDNSVVSWIEQTTTSGAEPDFPAPVLSLAAAAQKPAATTVPPVVATTSGSYSTLSLLALIFAIVALFGVGYLTVLAHRPKRSAPAS